MMDLHLKGLFFGILIFTVANVAYAGRSCQPIVVVDGELQYRDGSEVKLFGFNFQPSLSWEHGARMYNQNVLVPLQKEDLISTMMESLDEIEFLGGEIIRVHLHPADFTDAHGQLQEGFWLDMLDELMAELEQRQIYLYLTFINHLHHDGGEYPYNRNSFAAAHKREQWMEHPQAIQAAQNYVKALLQRKNPINGIPYLSHSTLAVLEPINEPAYIYKSMVAKKLSKDASGKVSQKVFDAYKYKQVKNYIDDMVDVIRSTGAQHPILWNCGWPKLIRKEKVSFSAVADSKVDGISFCLYPGQDDTKAWNQTENLQGNNYLNYLNRCLKDHQYLAWTLEKRFQNKAKVVYEYETWSNMSTYLYPAMAKLFRNLKAQIACQWTYALSSYATHNAGTHVFNLKTTPGKALSWMNAKRVFHETTRGSQWSFATEVDSSPSARWSFPLDLSASQQHGHLIHSSDLPKDFIPKEGSVQTITGRGHSAFAEYGGSGIYQLRDLNSDSIRLEIFPDVQILNEHWVERHTGEATFSLRQEASFPFEILDPRVDSNWKVYKKQGYRWIPVSTYHGKLRFDATAGSYVIRRQKISIRRAIFGE
jgi:hypothetical protein